MWRMFEKRFVKLLISNQILLGASRWGGGDPLLPSQYAIKQLMPSPLTPCYDLQPLYVIFTFAMSCSPLYVLRMSFVSVATSCSPSMSFVTFSMS